MWTAYLMFAVRLFNEQKYAGKSRGAGSFEHILDTIRPCRDISAHMSRKTNPTLTIKNWHNESTSLPMPPCVMQRVMPKCVEHVAECPKEKTITKRDPAWQGILLDTKTHTHTHTHTGTQTHTRAHNTDTQTHKHTHTHTHTHTQKNTHTDHTQTNMPQPYVRTVRTLTQAAPFFATSCLAISDLDFDYRQ